MVSTTLSNKSDQGYIKAKSMAGYKKQEEELQMLDVEATGKADIP